MRKTMLTATLALGGCTTAGMLENPPNYTFESDRPAIDVTQCIAVNARSAFQPSVINGSDRNIITYGNDLGPMTVITIYNREPTVVELRAKTLRDESQQEDIRDCL